jgi:hypothetical protein
MPRPVHYAAHGSGGLAFGCYFEEYERHRDSPVTTRLSPRGHYTKEVHEVGFPLRSTDLSKVTCSGCWKEIAAMVRGRA